MLGPFPRSCPFVALIFYGAKFKRTRPREQAKNSVTKLACDAVKSGSGRRLGPYRCVAQLKSQLGSAETWKVPSDPSAPDPGASSSSDSSDDDDEGQSDNAAPANMDEDQPMKVYD